MHKIIIHEGYAVMILKSKL